MNGAVHPLGGLAPLAAYRQFIPVLLQPKGDGKNEKLPVDHRTGQVTLKGSGGAHDPAIWLDYETAAGIVRSGGPSYGLGFVLTAADDLFVVDIDDALQGAAWSPLALELCGKLAGCVVEVSNSGRGLHLWGRAKPMPDHRKKMTARKIECYDNGRFILLGNGAVGTLATACPTIASVIAEYFPPDAQGSALVPDEGPCEGYAGPADDDELLQIAMRHKPRDLAGIFGGAAPKASFADLFECHVDVLARAYPPNDNNDSFGRSEADFALAGHLAYYTGRELARVERLMRRSKLARDKWDEHGSYLVEFTIRKACAGQARMYEPRHAALPGALEQFHRWSREEKLANWLPLALRMSGADAQLFVDEVQMHTNTKVSALKTALREARQAESTQAAETRFAELANGRTQVQWRRDASTLVAAEVERLIVASARPGEYVLFGGVLSQVATKPLPFTHLVDAADEAAPPVPQLEPLNDVAVLQRIERAALLFEPTDKGPKVIEVPERLVKNVLKNPASQAPTVTGLLTHPIVLRNGEILARDGHHAATGLYLAGVDVQGLRAYDQQEASAAVQRLRTEFFGEFEFRAPIDGMTAVAGLLTGVQRRLLDAAPGLAALAHTQSSGKTTLARLIHVVLTGHDMPATTFPDDKSEFQKQLLSILLRSPAMVCFDNLPDGATMQSAALAAAMTSAAVDQRVLGASKNATPLTNVLFVMTGNNLSLGPDEASRWMTCNLAPKSANPERRVFTHSNVMGRTLQLRQQVLRDAVGIVAGFTAAGAPQSAIGTRFPMWDRAVRQPLMWAAGVDVAEVFGQNAKENPEALAHASLMGCLNAAFAGEWFRSADIVAPGTFIRCGEPWRASTMEALETFIHGKPDSPIAISKALRSKIGRVAVVGGVPVRLVHMTATDHTARFRVEAAPAT